MKLVVLLTLLALALNLLIIQATVTEYDFIVVGAGTSGSIIATELSSNSTISVLVLERGDDNSGITSPAVGFWANKPSYGAGQYAPWLTGDKGFFVKKHFSTETTMSMRGLSHPSPILGGGGASVNGNAANRATEYDLLQFNNSLWTYNATLNAWKSLENCQGSTNPGKSCDTNYHGQNGPITTNTFTANNVLNNIINTMTTIFGVSKKDDTNGPTATGAGLMPRNIEVVNNEPVRQDTFTKFLKPVLSRTNLVLLKSAKVLRVLINETTHKHQVVYEYNNEIHIVQANKDIILSAGVFNTPKILMLSGIGDCVHLATIGISCTVNNTQVGKNMQDSVMSGLVFLRPLSILDTPVTKGPIAVTYYKSSYYTGSAPHDMEVATAPVAVVPLGSLISLSGLPGVPLPVEIPSGTAYLALIVHLLHDSTGELKLQSSNPHMEPMFSFNIYPNRSSVLPFVEALKKTRQLMTLNGMVEISPGAQVLPPIATDDQITDYLLKTVSSEYHTVGTSSMNKVVNGRLNLIKNDGSVVQGIRIADNGIIPQPLITHGTSMTSMLIGQRASELIKEDYNF